LGRTGVVVLVAGKHGHLGPAAVSVGELRLLLPFGVQLSDKQFEGLLI
jgi:hypothetical protein